MKKIYLLFSVLILFNYMLHSQCTINPGAQTTPGVSPTPDNLPCVIRGVAYDQTLQGKIQSGYDTTIVIEQVHITVDSVRLDSLAGLPAGINWSKNPNVLLGGGNGCVNFTGTTTAPTGRYYLTPFGMGWTRAQGTSPFPIDTPYVISGDLSQYSPFGSYYLDVINQGDQCHGVTAVPASIQPDGFSTVVTYNESAGKNILRFNSDAPVVVSVSLFDLSGREIFHYGNIAQPEFVLPALTSGIYIAETVHNGKAYRNKFSVR